MPHDVWAEWRALLQRYEAAAAAHREATERLLTAGKPELANSTHPSVARDWHAARKAYAEWSIVDAEVWSFRARWAAWFAALPAQVTPLDTSAGWGQDKERDS